MIVIAAVVMYSPNGLPPPRRYRGKRTGLIVFIAVKVYPLRRQIEVILRRQLYPFRANIPNREHRAPSQLTLDIKAPALIIRRNRAVFINCLWRLAGVEFSSIISDRNRPRAFGDGDCRRKHVIEREIG